MRPTHKNRSRSSNNRHRSSGGGSTGGGNPLSRVYESNGPDVKVRGTAQTIAEKYLQLGRDAQSSGDIVMAESYFQHGEHYLRLVTAAQAYNQQGQQQTFRRQDEDDDEEEMDDGTDTAPADPRLVAERPSADIDGMGDQPMIAEGDRQPQPQPPPQPQQQNYRQQRDYRDNRDPGARDQGRDQNRDQNRDQARDQNGQPYQNQNPNQNQNRDRYKPRWQDRRGEPQQGQNAEPRQNNQPQQPPQPRLEEPPRVTETPASAPVMAPPQPALVAAAETEAKWEAPSFLRRPAPAPVEREAEDTEAAAEPATPAVPAKRKYERKPRKEAVAETPVAAPPIPEPAAD